MKKTALLFREHAVQRMFERGICEQAVRTAVDIGEVVQEYPDDQPYPSRLLLGWYEEQPIHIVAAYDEQTQTDIIMALQENLWVKTWR